VQITNGEHMNFELCDSVRYIISVLSIVIY